MANNVTMTRANNTVAVKYWSNDTKQLYTTKANFVGTLNEQVKNEIRKQFEKMDARVVKFYDETIEKGTETKYSLDSEIFYKNANRVDKRPNGDYISRTAKASVLTITLYNNYTDDIETASAIIDGTNEQVIARNIRKRYKNSDCVVLDYEITDTITALYIMTVDKFIELATVEE